MSQKRPRAGCRSEVRELVRSGIAVNAARKSDSEKRNELVHAASKHLKSGALPQADLG